mgnify:CR=1 FL=1
MTHRNVLGIDYSMSCPALCLTNGTTHRWWVNYRLTGKPYGELPNITWTPSTTEGDVPRYIELAAWVLAVVTAVPIGIAMGVSRVMRGIFDPPIEFYRPLPPLAYLPLMIIWFGSGQVPRVTVCVLISLFPIVTNTTRSPGIASSSDSSP